MKKILAMCMALALVLSFGSFAMGEAEPVNVAIVVAGGLGDRSFYDSANEGLQSLIADYGVNGTVIECKEDASMYTTQLINAAETNDFVVAVGWQFWDGLVEIVPELPDTRFIFVDNGLDGVGDNLMSITYAQNEGSFLVGYIAAKLSETGKIGAVGSSNISTSAPRLSVLRISTRCCRPTLSWLTRAPGSTASPYSRTKSRTRASAARKS